MDTPLATYIALNGFLASAALFAVFGGLAAWRRERPSRRRRP
jgi:hypothetical protein